LNKASCHIFFAQDCTLSLNNTMYFHTISPTLTRKVHQLHSYLVHKDSCGAHATSYTHTRAQNFPVLSLEFCKPCHNLSNSSFEFCQSYPLDVHREDSLIARGCEMAMAPPLRFYKHFPLTLEETYFGLIFSIGTPSCSTQCAN